MASDFCSQMNNNNKPISPDEFVLEHVHGVTVPDKNGIAASPVTDQVAYAADRILVILNPITSQQMFIETPSAERSIACLAFSKDGRLVGFAEQGPKPFVSIWLVREFKVLNKFQVNEYKRGPTCIQFHPKKPLIIMMSQEEPRIMVYDYIRGVKTAIAVLKYLLYDMDISQDGTYLLVCGYRKIRYYALNSIDDTKNDINIMQTKRTVSLGNESEYLFIGITMGKSRNVYAITACGVLCKMKLRGVYIEKKEKIDKQLSCLCYGLDLLFLGCCNSTVKMCYPEDLSVAAVISLSEMLGPEIRIPGLQDVVTQGIVLSEAQSTITCVYSDYNIYSWQLKGDNDSIECKFILPSYLKKAGRQGSEAYGTLTQELFKTSLLKQYMGAPSNSSNMMDKARRDQKAPGMTTGCEPNAVKISPDGRDIVVGDDKGELKIYEAATGVIKKVIEAHNSQVTFIELMYNETHKLVCSGGRDRVIFILDAADNFNLVQVLCAHSSAIKAIKLLCVCDDLTLVSASVDGVVLVWQASMEPQPKFHVVSQIFDLVSKTHQNIMLDCTQSYFVKGDKNGTVQLMNMEPDHTMLACKNLQKNKNSPGGIRGLDIDPSGSFLAVGFVNGYTTVYHLQSGQIVATLSTQRDLQSIKFAKDLSYMIIFSKHCALVWKLPERMEEYMRSRLTRDSPSAACGENDTLPFDTFLKSSRVVRGTSESETSFASGDRTPTIRTMNLLNHSRSMNSIKEELSASSSSMTASSSSSEIHLDNHYTSSDASVRMNSLPDVNIHPLESIYSGKKAAAMKDIYGTGEPSEAAKSPKSFSRTCIQRRNRSASCDNKVPLNKSRNSVARHNSTHSCSRRAIIKTTSQRAIIKTTSQNSSLVRRRVSSSTRPPIGKSKTDFNKTTNNIPKLVKDKRMSPILLTNKPLQSNCFNEQSHNYDRDRPENKNSKKERCGRTASNTKTKLTSSSSEHTKRRAGEQKPVSRNSSSVTNKEAKVLEQLYSHYKKLDNKINTVTSSDHTVQSSKTKKSPDAPQLSLESLLRDVPIEASVSKSLDGSEYSSDEPSVQDMSNFTDNENNSKVCDYPETDKEHCSRDSNKTFTRSIEEQQNEFSYLDRTNSESEISTTSVSVSNQMCSYENNKCSSKFPEFSSVDSDNHRKVSKIRNKFQSDNLFTNDISVDESDTCTGTTEAYQIFKNNLQSDPAKSIKNREHHTIAEQSGILANENLPFGLDEMTEHLLGSKRNDCIKRGTINEEFKKVTSTNSNQDTSHGIDVASLSFTQRHRMFANKAQINLKAHEKDLKSTSKQPFQKVKPMN